MSTYIYLECLDHDPPLRADDESGQHLSDVPRVRAEIADREAVAANQDYYAPSSVDDCDMDAYFRSHSSHFLAAHTKCRIGIRDEYGINYTPDDPEQR
jgi:hypothetical protein